MSNQTLVSGNRLMRLKAHPRFSQWRYCVYWNGALKTFQQKVVSDIFAAYYPHATFWEYLQYLLKH